VAKVPAHEMIFSEIKMQIAMSVYKVGEKIPSESELARQFGVSRMTVRHALGRLSNEHVLTRYPGVGTFVKDPSHNVVNRKVGRLGSFSDEIGYSGVHVRSEVKVQEVTLANDEVKENLQLRQNQQVIHLVRVRIVQGAKAALQETWLPFNLVSELAHIPMEDKSLYAMLKDICGIELLWAQQDVSASTADDHIGKLLGIPIGTAVLNISRVTFDNESRPIEFAKSWTRSEYPLTMRLDK
jgi:GntR family transcriptional regulator